MTLCLWLGSVRFGLVSFADYPYVTDYVGLWFSPAFALCLNFFPLFTQSHKHTICSMHRTSFFHRSISFVSVLFVNAATHRHKKNSTYLTTLSFFQLAHPMIISSMSRFAKKKMAKSQRHGIEHASTKSACKNTDFYTTHCHETGMQRAMNAMQCTT